MVSIFLWLIVGAVIGVAGNRLVSGSFAATLPLGMIGAVVGGVITVIAFPGFTNASIWQFLLPAALGAIIALLLFRLVKNRH